MCASQDSGRALSRTLGVQGTGNYILCSHRIISCLSPTLLSKKRRVTPARLRPSWKNHQATKTQPNSEGLQDVDVNGSEALFSGADVGVLSSETPLSEKMLDFKRLVLRSPGGRAVPAWDKALLERLRLGHLTILLRRQGPRFPGPVAVISGSWSCCSAELSTPTAQC